MLRLILLFALATTILAKYQYSDPFAWWDTDDHEEYSDTNTKRIPFPQCLVAGSKSKFFGSSSLQKLFDRKLKEEEDALKSERYENYKHDNYGNIDSDGYNDGNDYSKTRTAASAAIKLTRDIMTVLACDLNGTDTDNLNNFLNKFKVPEEFCSYKEQIDCTGKTDVRTPTGICNNVEFPYRGSAKTAFGRILPPEYNDGLSEPRKYGTRGGYLPECRDISLALGSKPIFDRSFNNFFVIYGQFIAHDIALSTPVSDTYATPISSCRCDSSDWNKCTVIDVRPDDPYLRGQKCMAFPATAQAFKNQICSLGLKEQLNTNSHFTDLSSVYGSSDTLAAALRGDDGTLKSSKRYWSKYELPPAQREGKSCIDGSSKRPCFAGGDSRLMENLLFTGIHTIFLRFHNTLALAFKQNYPDIPADVLYHLSRHIVTGIYQIITYHYWLPTLLGPKHGNRLQRDLLDGLYNKDVDPVVFNEVATGAFRLHSLVRDLFSRCTPDGKRIDQLWLHDISHKSKYAYDIENNGIDSILCGSLYDYGFAHDGNYAHQIHHRLFESTNKNGQLWRNDLIAINICRGREHGVRSYNAYREYCGFKTAAYFEDFGDTINYNGIKLLEKLYDDPEDVDLYVALNLEDPVEGGIVGPVSACLIEQQFRALCEGDRFCPLLNNPDISLDVAGAVAQSYLVGILCKTVDIKQVPKFPFRPPNENDNPLIDCATVPDLIEFIVGSTLIEQSAGRSGQRSMPLHVGKEFKMYQEYAKKQP